MSPIRNTSKAMREDPAEPLAFLADALVTGSQSNFIESQERAGQSQLVNSDRLPSDHGEAGPWLALGFTFGKPDADDPLFMPATLPPGWKREGSSHAMWSHILDEHGRQRVAIFYKAAFYDRRAFMHLVSLSSYAGNAVEYPEDSPAIVFDGQWATPEAVREAMEGRRDHERGEAKTFAGYAQADNRDEHNRAECARIAGDYEKRAALYDAAIAKLLGDES